ncbi:hypothetical protein SteCoe_1624 [Stentor coeruleus]|uniref:Uncharacterized protein n=1 Tax=Stentor coeruleus TaxID=5963 RepID=A0A1R2D1F6_9CILI|nr:hypothetical protein SteCoe_1624 [Stentor coeruleus]
MFLIALLTVFVQADTDRPFSILGFTGVAGEILMNPLTGSSLFFWQYNSQNGNITTDTRPLVIWTQGGPGCASELGMLAEGISPIYIDDSGNPQPSSSTWITRVHLLAIDFPYGAGFSYASQYTDAMNTSFTATNYLYSFLQTLGSKYPTWFQRDVYWFGEDYSGRFVPEIAATILHNNQIQGNIVIKLKGIALGDPWLDAQYQTQYYDMSAFYMSLVNPQQQSILASAEQNIYNQIQAGNFSTAYSLFQLMLGQFESFSDNVDIYDTRTYTMPSFSGLSSFLNSNTTKSMLGVPLGSTWQICNPSVKAAFGNDSMLNLTSTFIPYLLGQMKVMIYHGEDDMYCNTPGLSHFLKSLNWPYIQNFMASRRGTWSVMNNIAGYAQTYSNLTYIQVLDAGNQVGVKQPYALRDLAFRFIFNQGWN